MELEALLQQHGGYRRLKSFQTAPLCYDVTVRFCDRSPRLARGAFSLAAAELKPKASGARSTAYFSGRATMMPASSLKWFR